MGNHALSLLLLEANLLPWSRHGVLELPAGYETRTSRLEDTEELGLLYFASYDRDVGCETEGEAIADIALAFAGEYGELWLDASPVITRDGVIVAAVQSVFSAPWPDAPPGPFITEVFTDRGHRRIGLARTMLLSVMATMRLAGNESVSLRVRDSNSAGRLLYASLGFRQTQ